jgi:hypothetical protein
MNAQNQDQCPLPADAPGEEPIMLTFTVTDIVRIRGRSRFPVQSWPALKRLARTLAVGLPAIMLAMHLLDPAAPLGYIVVPVLAGGLLPLFMMPPGQFEVATRAAGTVALAGALEHTIAAMGYEKTPDASGVLRYRARRHAWLAWHDKEVELAVRGQTIQIRGPVASLHALRARLAGNAALLGG